MIRLGIAAWANKTIHLSEQKWQRFAIAPGQHEQCSAETLLWLLIARQNVAILKPVGRSRIEPSPPLIACNIFAALCLPLSRVHSQAIEETSWKRARLSKSLKCCLTV